LLDKELSLDLSTGTCLSDFNEEDQLESLEWRSLSLHSST